MPRGKRFERVYTGKAAKLDEKVKALEETLKAIKAEREAAYKEQLKEERKAKKNQAAQRQKDLLKAAENSGKSIDELIEIINTLPNIETVEREDTGLAVLQLVEASTFDIDQETMNTWFDEIRDF